MYPYIAPRIVHSIIKVCMYHVYCTMGMSRLCMLYRMPCLYDIVHRTSINAHRDLWFVTLFICVHMSVPMAIMELLVHTLHQGLGIVTYTLIGMYYTCNTGS